MKCVTDNFKDFENISFQKSLKSLKFLKYLDTEILKIEY